MTRTPTELEEIYREMREVREQRDKRESATEYEEQAEVWVRAVPDGATDPLKALDALWRMCAALEQRVVDLERAHNKLALKVPDLEKNRCQCPIE